MKKTLVALAALASVSAFAQSSVTIDGYIDRGALVSNNSNSAKSTKGLGSNAGTTTIGIKGVTDLGNGLKAGFSVNTDWADLGGVTQDSATITQPGTFANSQSFAELVSASFGTLRLGSPNNDTLTNAISVASPAFSTGVGSAYSSSWSIHNGYGTGVTGSGGIVSQTALGSAKGGARGIRQANTVKYISPSFSGLTVSYSAAAQNEQGTAGTGHTVGVTEAAARYTNGPLDVMYTTLEYKVGSVAPTAGTDIPAANTSSKQNLLGVAYQVLPTLKLHAGFGSSKASATTIANSSSTQYGVTYNLTPVIDVMAQVAKVDDKNATAYDRKMTGLGVDYKFSKTTRAYIRMDSLNLDTSRAASSGSEIKRTAVGFSQSF
jgi:predicted porin